MMVNQNRVSIKNTPNLKYMRWTYHNTPFKNSATAPTSHYNCSMSCRLVGQSESDPVLVSIKDGVILAQKRVAEDPQKRRSGIDCLDAHLALINTIGVSSSEDIEIWFQWKVVTGNGDRDDRQRLHIGTIGVHFGQGCVHVQDLVRGSGDD